MTRSMRHFTCAFPKRRHIDCLPEKAIPPDPRQLACWRVATTEDMPPALNYYSNFKALVACCGRSVIVAGLDTILTSETYIQLL